MTAGLFELRKDPITSWWVATVVDRAFPLAEAGAALRYLTGGTARGRIVLTL